jgi:opacity protein-like surface antigen
MKSFLFAALASATLLISTSAFAAPTPANGHDRDGRYQQGPARRDDQRNDRRDDKRDDRRDDHFDRNQNYGFDRSHRVTMEERRRWEMGHNYGYAQNHRVSRQEQARWEAQYRRR